MSNSGTVKQNCGGKGKGVEVEENLGVVVGQINGEMRGW